MAGVTTHGCISCHSTFDSTKRSTQVSFRFGVSCFCFDHSCAFALTTVVLLLWAWTTQCFNVGRRQHSLAARIHECGAVDARIHAMVMSTGGFELQRWGRMLQRL
jgi:hypothetical protein